MRSIEDNYRNGTTTGTGIRQAYQINIFVCDRAVATSNDEEATTVRWRHATMWGDM